MTAYYDSLETRDPAQRERDLFGRLPAQLAHARVRTRAYAKLLDHVEVEQVTDRLALARLPVTRKSELLDLQRQERPFGGFAAGGWGDFLRVFASPGTIYEPESARPDYWRLARALHAAGFRRGDLVHNCFAYHFTPAGSMLETGAHALGCTVFPGGIGQTEQQVQAMHELGPAGYVGTPSFLKIILDKAQEMGLELPSLKKALVSGEAFPGSTRQALAERGIIGFQAYATADLGLIAYESEAREGLIVDEQVIVEILRPGTGDPVPEGEVGEVVVTSMNPDYPLIRFGTGDLSAFLPGISPCGRTAPRIKGWMGRADQTAKVRGLFVHPSQVAEVVKRHAEVSRARLVIDNPEGQDRMRLVCETQVQTNALAEALVHSLRDVTKLRGEIEFRGQGELANDGKVIEDLRQYD